MYGVNSIVRNNLAITTKSERAKQPGAHAARAIEIASALTPGERNIFNQSGRLPPIIADKALVDGYDDFLLAKLVREHLDYLAPLREADLRKIGDRYAPVRSQREARPTREDRHDGGVRHPYQQRRG